MFKRIFIIALMLCCAVTPQAIAQTSLGFKAVGANLGYVSPENVDGTIGLGVFADFGTVTPAIMLEGYAAYWSKGTETLLVSSSVRDIVLGARAKYRFNVSNKKVTPFAGVGMGVHFLSAESTAASVNAVPATTISDSATKLGLDVGGGVSTVINPKADFFGEMWYTYVTDASQLQVKVGVSYKIGQ